MIAMSTTENRQTIAIDQQKQQPYASLLEQFMDFSITQPFDFFANSEQPMKLLGAAILATILAVSTACSCVALTPQEAYDGAQWVSRVLIVSKREEIVSDFEQFIIYTVHYITVFKNIKRKRHLCTEMRTPKETATCGVPFLEPGKEYLLAGSFDDSDEPTINNCLQILGPGNIPEWKGVPSEIKTKLKAGAFDSTLQR
ncbi:unnamed protein product [Toxocara canis]|uniref:NTR domain-containing protein n=1 Tax=Toxocara canis TaxID=6265 RepID=A0A3P7F509_TOXCA|nr:unnamed protein product [Toxocara canis]